MRLLYISRYAILLCGLFTLACEKQTVVSPDFATLQVYGWTPNESVVVLNLNDGPLARYSEAASIDFKPQSIYMNKLNINQPQQVVSFYAYPDTFPQSKPVLKLNFALEKNKIYSLFLGGIPNALDTMFMEEKFPILKPSDSVANVRFLNLVKDVPVNINFVGEPSGSLAQNVPYMGITEFKSIPVNDATNSYAFEIRNAITDEILFTDSYDAEGPQGKKTNWLARLRTHAIIGVNADPNPQNMIQVDLVYHN